MAHLRAALIELGPIGRPAALLAVEPESFWANAVLEIRHPRRPDVDDTGHCACTGFKETETNIHGHQCWLRVGWLEVSP